MRLSAESQRLVEEFLRERFHLRTLRLSPISVYHGRVALWITRTFRIGAITFGRRIFIAPDMIKRNEQGMLTVPGWLLAHEATHVWQYQLAGFIGFLISYLGGYWRALREQGKWNSDARTQAYLAIREERDARESEAIYSNWLAEKKLEASEAGSPEPLDGL
jgi:hypothetical protein